VLKLDDPMFREPSQNRTSATAFRWTGSIAEGVDPTIYQFDLTEDQPDNRILDSYGNLIFRLGSLRKDNNARRWWSSESQASQHGTRPGRGIDEVGTGPRCS
jgi:hypothetical protein